MFLHLRNNVLQYNGKQQNYFGVFMKKFITLLIATVFLLLNIVGCGGVNSISYEGKYWYKDPTSSINIYEQLTYDVKVVSRTEGNSNEIKNEHVALELSEGSYVTTFTKDGENYVFETALNTKGKYVYQDTSKAIENDLYSKSVFNVNTFKPVSSQKKSNNTTTMMTTKTGIAFIEYCYDYTVNYNGNNAETVYNSQIFTEKSEPSTITNTFKNYNDNPYIDNEVLTFMPRAFKIKDKESFTLSFTTLDVLTQKIHDMTYTTTTPNSKMDIKTLNISYENVINGETIANSENKIQVVKLLLSINDTFSGASIELYYSIDHQNDRHRLIKAYTPLNDNMGYIEYTLKSAVLNTNI